MTQPALLTDRAVLRISGENVREFLNGLVTNEMTKGDDAVFAALLTPQGKILAEMIISDGGDGALYVDTPAEGAAALMQRLAMYKLRAKIEVADVSDTLGVVLHGAGAFADPRHDGLPPRAIAPREGVPAADGYDAARIALGAPELFKDYQPADIFPADAAMDWFNGVNLKKGCFVGQEVVSRMHRKGTLRKRMLPVKVEGGAPEAGTPVTADEKPVGDIRSSNGADAIALLRIDRLEKAETPPVTDGRRVDVLRTGAP